MKKNLLFIFLLLAAFFGAFANPVNEAEATRAAKNFYHHISGKTAYITQTVKTEKAAGKAVYYIINMNNEEGFVIISADDRTHPILAYNSTGAFHFGPGSESVVKWLEKYKKEIAYIVDKGLEADSKIHDEWNWAYTGNYPSTSGSRSTTTVSPLLTCTWNQDPYYNDDCPYNTARGERCVTGCVATAMAQIMKFWGYPAQGSGNHSYNTADYGTLSADFGSTVYNWAGMPNSISGPNAEIARLNFHCGVAVEMSYGPGSTGGSSAYVVASASPSTYCAEYAYKTFFRYDATSINGRVRSDFSDAAWISMLKADLDASRPIQYAGFGPGGGHTWVCDGYDASDMFHMNWGWGGVDNGFYNLDALSPSVLGSGGGSGDFNSGQQAVLGIKPVTGGGSVGGGLQLNSAVVATPNPVSFDGSFSVTADITNGLATTFSGDLCAALLKTDGSFVAYVSTLTGRTISAGASTGTLTFSSTGILTVPGNYLIGIYAKAVGGNWVLVSAGSYVNPINFTINGPLNGITLSADIVPSPTNWVQGAAVSLNTNILNNTASTYTGTYSADLYDLSGNFVENIGTITESTGLPA